MEYTVSLSQIDSIQNEIVVNIFSTLVFSFLRTLCISIEGYLVAQSDPKNYIDVLASDGTTVVAKLSDNIQGLGAHGRGLESLVSSIGLSRTTAGARLNNAESQQDVLVQRSISIKTEIGKLRDADIETLITELQSILVTRDAARQTYSTVNNQTLFDFLR